MSRYPFQLGLPAFREASAAWMEALRRAPRPVPRVLPLIGSKEGIAHIAFATSAPATHVCRTRAICRTSGGTLLAGGEPYAVPLRPENRVPDPFDRFPSMSSPAARVLYLNYPNNPTAADRAERVPRGGVQFCREHAHFARL
jgi:LL-diaminopimelate aminotransferase